jgi:hypothetical protein
MGIKDTFWRTLVRVVEVKDGTVWVVLPAWDAARKQVPIPLDSFPEEIRPLLVPDFRLHAKANTSVHSVGNLRFKDWEPS